MTTPERCPKCGGIPRVQLMGPRCCSACGYGMHAELPKSAMTTPERLNWQDHCKTHTELHDEIDRLRAERDEARADALSDYTEHVKEHDRLAAELSEVRAELVRKERRISVRERNPEPGNTILVSNGRIVWQYLFSGHSMAGSQAWAAVTHWMPLPAPPKDSP